MKEKEIELKDTIEGMQSDDYKQRFIAEYEQVCIRIKKLERFVGKIKYAKYADAEEPKHDCPLGLLQKQLFSMNVYRLILETRAEEFEHIELPKILGD